MPVRDREMKNKLIQTSRLRDFYFYFFGGGGCVSKNTSLVISPLKGPF